jgi:hypothetical protein
MRSVQYVNDDGVEGTLALGPEEELCITLLCLTYPTESVGFANGDTDAAVEAARSDRAARDALIREWDREDKPRKRRLPRVEVSEALDTSAKARMLERLGDALLAGSLTPAMAAKAVKAWQSGERSNGSHLTKNREPLKASVLKERRRYRGVEAFRDIEPQRGDGLLPTEYEAACDLRDSWGHEHPRREGEFYGTPSLASPENIARELCVGILRRLRWSGTIEIRRGYNRLIPFEHETNGRLCHRTKWRDDKFGEMQKVCIKWKGYGDTETAKELQAIWRSLKAENADEAKFRKALGYWSPDFAKLLEHEEVSEAQWKGGMGLAGVILYRILNVPTRYWRLGNLAELVKIVWDDMFITDEYGRF